MRFLKYISIVLFSMFILSACSNDKPRYMLEEAYVTEIVVTPSNAKVPVGVTGQFKAYAFLSDGTNSDITDQAIWSSADDAVVVFSDIPGHAKALIIGNTIVKASLGSMSGTTAIEVVDTKLLEIIVTPALTTVIDGQEMVYKAKGIYDNGLSVPLEYDTLWKSGNVGVATVSADGIATGTGAGTTNITATLDGITGSATLNVTAATVASITISPIDVSVPVGTTGTYTATATLSDGTTQDITRDATWVSGDDSVVHVVTKGETAGDAKALSVGNTTITASFNGVPSNTATIEVTTAVLESIQITPVSQTAASGIEVTYSAIGIYSDGSHHDLTDGIWTILDKSLVSDWSYAGNTLTATADASGGTGTTEIWSEMDNGSGTMIRGTATLTVTAATATSIEVTPPSATVPVGVTGHFTAYAHFTDGSSNDVTSQVVWSSADSAVVGFSVDAGKATAIAVGNTTVKASLGTTSGTAAVEVISLTLDSIVLTPTTKTVAVGQTFTYTAMGHYNDGSTQDLTWDTGWLTSDKEVATVSTKTGEVTTYSAGTATIVASYWDPKSETTINSNDAILTVTAAAVTAITISPADASVPVGTTGTFTAMATLSDGTPQDITADATWKSSDDSVVHVENGDNAGNAKALKVGNATITALFKGITSNTATRTVTAATLVSIQVDPVSKTIPVGIEVDYTATGIYSDDTHVDITQDVSWTIPNKIEGGASLEQSSERVWATGVQVSTAPANIEARLSGITGNATLTVTAETATSIVVTPANTTQVVGTTGHFSAYAYFTDGSQYDVTEQAIWSSNDSSVVGIQEAGKAIAKTVGNTTVKASLGLTSGTAAVEVIALELESITITPDPTTVVAGTVVDFTAIGHYNDSSDRELTSSDTAWTSSNTDAATIDQDGVATTYAAADNIIIEVGATDNTSDDFITATATLNVTAATVSSITISPADATVPVGTTSIYSAIATLSNGKVQDITKLVTWIAVDTNVTHIQSKGEEAGYAKALNVGSTTLTAVFKEVTSNTASIVVVSNITLSSISIEPKDHSTYIGGEILYHATGTYSDGSTVDFVNTDLTWGSSKPSIASISPDGIATGSSLGDTTITATFTGSPISDSTSLHVTDTCGELGDMTGVRVSPTSLDMDDGDVEYLILYGLWGNNGGCEQDIGSEPGVVWQTEDQHVAKVGTGGQAGKVTATGPGDTIIHGKYKGTVEYGATASVTVQ